MTYLASRQLGVYAIIDTYSKGERAIQHLPTVCCEVSRLPVDLGERETRQRFAAFVRSFAPFLSDPIQLNHSLDRASDGGGKSRGLEAQS